MQTINLNLPENFNIYDHVAELKAQGFMLLSYLLEQKENKIKIKTKQIAQKLGVHVSTLRRWIKRLIGLGFAVIPDSEKQEAKPSVAHSQGSIRKIDSALSADPTPCDRDAIRNDSAPKDPLEYLIDTLTPMEAAALRMKLRAVGLDLGEEDTDNKPKLKQVLLTNPEYLKELVEIYEFRENRLAQRKVQHEARLKQIANEKEKYGDRLWHKMYVPRVGLS